MRRLLETASYITFAMVLVSLPACKDPLPCTNCEAEGDEDEPAADLPPDLPCGGADFSTDPDNCGGCGNGCLIRGEGTEWEAGGCENGECLPRWDTCFPLPSDPPRSCADYCGQHCVANGCGGHTAIFVASNPFDPKCFPDLEPFATFDGACDEPMIIDPPEEGLHVTFKCCCG